MRLHIDYNSSQPIYRQAVEQIKLMVVGGQLEAGEKVPSIRQLARQLKINPTTAAKVYTELAHEGVLALRQGQGAFVASCSQALASAEVRRVVGGHARRMLVEGLRLGLTKEAIGVIVDEEHARITKGRS